MASVCFQELDTPMGRLRVAASSRGICRIGFPSVKNKHWLLWFERHLGDLVEERCIPLLEEALGQLGEYFQTKRRFFELPLDLRGTAFQLRVWRELRKIPYGFTVSYGEVARRIHNPRASQAVGSAVGRNPVPLLVPCHRVVGHNGSLVGFGGGLDLKEKLLELEGARMPFV